MERKFIIGGKEHLVSAPDRQEASFRAGGEGFAFITVDGVKRAVDIIESTEHHIDLIVDARRVVLHTGVGDRDEERWFGVDGRARVVSPRDVRRRRRGTDIPGGQGHLVTPSFPATVVKVMVRPGEVVAKGQALVVVSAMKMEMTLSSPRDGVVEAVNVEEGATVSPGDELVVIGEPEASDE